MLRAPPPRDALIATIGCIRKPRPQEPLVVRGAPRIVDSPAPAKGRGGSDADGTVSSTVAESPLATGRVVSRSGRLEGSLRGWIVDFGGGRASVESSAVATGLAALPGTCTSSARSIAVSGGQLRGRTVDFDRGRTSVGLPAVTAGSTVLARSCSVCSGGMASRVSTEVREDCLENP